MLGRNPAQLEQDPASRKAVRREWLKYFEQHPIADLRHYYTFLFPVLEQAAAQQWQQWQQWQGLDEFAALFAQRKFIAERYDNTRQTGEVLAEYGAQLAEHPAAATAAPLPSESRAANWLGSLLNLYFHHSTHDQPENLTPAAALVRPYLQRFPKQYSGFFESYLEQAPDPAAAFAALLPSARKTGRTTASAKCSATATPTASPTATPPPSSKPPCPNATPRKPKPCNNKC